MPVKVRKEFQRSGIGPQIFNDHGVSMGGMLPRELLGKQFRVLEIKYDLNDQTFASDLLWITHDGRTSYWVRRGDTVEVIEKVRPLKRSEQNEMVAAMKELIQGYTTGDCYNTVNPYCRPYVKKALELLAKIEGKADYLDVKLG